MSATSNLNEFLTKFSEHVEVDVAVPELAVTSLPRLLACRPWQAASGSSGNCITVTAGNHHPHVGEQGRVLVFRQQFWSTLQFFHTKKRTYCLAIRTKHELGFSTSSRATVFSRFKTRLGSQLV